MWYDWTVNKVYNAITPTGHPLSFPFVAIPMNVDGSHWILCIVAYASDILGDLGTERPGGARTCLILLDSIGGDRTFEAKKIRQLLVKLGEGRFHLPEDRVMQIPTYQPEVGMRDVVNTSGENNA